MVEGPDSNRHQPSWVASFEDYWKPFLAGATPTSALAAALDRESEGELERMVRSRIGDGQMDGSFELPARALAIIGVKD